LKNSKSRLTQTVIPVLTLMAITQTFTRLQKYTGIEARLINRQF
jgi:hypothetical protein